MKIAIAAVTALLMLPALSVAQQPPASKVKVLSGAEDPRQKNVLVGRSEVAGMIVQFELEPAKSMWMRFGNRVEEHRAQANEQYHVEVKPIDPTSRTRISFTRVEFVAANRTTGKQASFFLHPMWGASGLHYASNAALLGDGEYAATITVEMASFARDEKTKDLWLQPVTAAFHLKLQGGALIEVSEPIPGGG